MDKGKLPGILNLGTSCGGEWSGATLSQENGRFTDSVMPARRSDITIWVNLISIIFPV
jgi:hypothetical protein